MNNPNPVSNSLPDDYQEILYWRITEEKSRILFMNILAIPLFIIFGLFFSALADRLGRLPSSIEFGLREVGMILLGVILTLVLHELVHGMAMRMYGANPKYGVMWKQMILYAISPGFAYCRNNYVVVALAPLVLISILIVLPCWLFVEPSMRAGLWEICG